MKLLVVSIIVGTLVACGSASTPTQDGVQAALVTSGIPKSQARCATRQLFTILTPKQLRELAERGSGALDEKASTALSTALGTCTAGATSTAPASATTSPQTAPLTSKP